MLKTSLWPLQVALYQRLNNDTALSELIKGVYDDVPEEVEDDQGNKIPVELPYVTIGDPTVLPFETKSTFGEQVTVVLHCWSQYEGKKEAYDILNLMFQAITKESWDLEGGFKVFKISLEQMNVILDIDNETKHGIMRLRFHINN